MAEEGRVLEDRIENRLDGMETRLSRLDGTVEQMDRRLSNLEQGQRQLQVSLEQGLRQIMAGQEQGSRWLIGLVVGAWLTIMLTILFKG